MYNIYSCIVLYNPAQLVITLLVQKQQRIVGQEYILLCWLLFDSFHSCMLEMQCGRLHYQQCSHPVWADHQPAKQAYSYKVYTYYKMLSVFIPDILARCTGHIGQQNIVCVDWIQLLIHLSTMEHGYHTSYTVDLSINFISISFTSLLIATYIHS